MAKTPFTLLAATMIAAAIPAIAQQTGQQPGAIDASRVIAGDYTTDSNHSQVAWAVNHYGFNLFHGLFGNPTGTLKIDPAKPSEAMVAIDIPLDKVVTTSAGLNEHLKKPDFFDVAQFPIATFRSTSVSASGTKARISGNLTIKGVTKPVVLDAQLSGAGVNPRNKKETVGFEATTTISRSDFGIVYGLPAVADRVDLRITVAFERVAS